jgi:hypothetical protein
MSKGTKNRFHNVRSILDKDLVDQLRINNFDGNPINLTTIES